MPKPLRTERLTLRPQTETDFEFLAGLHGDAEVMKFITGSAVPLDQTRIGFDRSMQIARENPGLGAWVIELTNTGEGVGHFILRHPSTQEKLEGVEIGYAFHTEHWRKGYANESCLAVIRYVFDVLKLNRINALIKASNLGSQRLVEKLGFRNVGIATYVRPATGETSESLLFVLDPSDLRATDDRSG